MSKDLVLRALFTTALLLGTIALTTPSASAQHLGEVCVRGQHAVITAPVNIRISLVCTKVGKTFQYSNSDGRLHLTTYTNTVAQELKPYRMYLPVMGGRPGYQCALGAGSGLPTGFNIAHAGQVINRVWNCVIASGSVPALNPGTTKLVTPPFTVVFNDSSTPIQRTSVKLQITIIASGPHIKVTAAAGTCTVGTYCDVPMGGASGGTKPYTFHLDTLLAGAPPMGMTFSPDGHLRGTPTVAGTSILGVCVSDATGASDCTGTQIQVNPAPAPTVVPPSLADLDGSYSATFTPTYKFDDVTVLKTPIPFSFQINNGQITGGATGQITWSVNSGSAPVTVLLTFGGKSASCSSVWGWQIDSSHRVALQAALHCFGSYVYNDGTVIASKDY